jgi:membrane fusion protein, multidrug efflux system
MKVKVVGGVLLLMLPLCLLQGCQKPEEEKKEDAAVPVEVAAVRTGLIEAAYRGTATLEAEDEATVMAKTGGVIEQILVEEGDRVRAGAVLARLETDKLELEVARASASADKLEQDFKRNESVYQRNLISREAYERTKFELEAARAAADLAQLALQDSEIKAPFDGVITARHIKRGNTLQAGEPAFRVTRLDRLQANLHVPERDIHKLRAGHPVKLTVDAWPGRTFDGAIIRVNPVVDASSGTVKVTALMAVNKPELKPGMFGRVEILYDKRDNAILVDRDAVLTEDAQQSVFVINEGKARRRLIKTGYSDAYNYEVVEGLQAGDQVVTTGQSNLKDDAKVQAVNVGGPASAAPPQTADAADAKS